MLFSNVHTGHPPWVKVSVYQAFDDCIDRGG
jgi:hypothetical protein